MSFLSGRGLKFDLTMLAPSALTVVGGVTTLVSDTFTDSDSTVLSAHTPDIDTVGGGWTAGTGTPDIQSNKASSPDDGDVNADIDAGNANVIVSADVLIATANDGFIGLAMRYTSTTSKWSLEFSTTLLKLVERDTTSTTRASTAITVAKDAEHALSATCSGDDFTCTINGGDEITYTSTFNNSVTNHGLFGGNTASTWDNFLVTTV